MSVDQVPKYEPVSSSTLLFANKRHLVLVLNLIQKTSATERAWAVRQAQCWTVRTQAACRTELQEAFSFNSLIEPSNIPINPPCGSAYIPQPPSLPLPPPSSPSSLNGASEACLLRAIKLACSNGRRRLRYDDENEVHYKGIAWEIEKDQPSRNDTGMTI